MDVFPLISCYNQSKQNSIHTLVYTCPASLSGADLGFSRGGGADFQKIFQNFDDLFFFFRSTKLIFRALPKHCFGPTLAKFSAPQANF